MCLNWCSDKSTCYEVYLISTSQSNCIRKNIPNSPLLCTFLIYFSFRFIDIDLRTFPLPLPLILHHQLDLVEEDKANLAAQCEELQLSLEHQREKAQSLPTTSESSIQTHPEEEGGAAVSGTHSNSDASRRLDCWEITPRGFDVPLFDKAICESSLTVSLLSVSP